MTVDLSSLAVEVLHYRAADKYPEWSVGSGFFVGSRLVLTAWHNVDGPGELLVRVHGKEEYPAVVRLQGDKDTVDLAVLEVSDVAVDVPPLRYGVVDRSAPMVVERCWAIGFPRFKQRAHDPRPLRFSTQVDGEIPTGENLDQSLLTLRVKNSPRPLPSGSVHESEWEGISGATVFSGNNIIVGVITEHHLPEGESALTLVPITAIDDLLPEAMEWWKLLGMDRQALVRLPGEDGQHFDSFDDVQRRWFEREAGCRERIFRDELSGHFDGVPSPLSDYWNHFIKAPSWHEKVKGLLNNMHELAKGFPELASLALSLKQVNCDANYDAILASLRQLFADHNKTVADVIANLKRASQQLAQPSEKEIEARRNAERLHSSMYYLDAQTKSPSFQRCFLLIGSLGAGKTHFIASLLATSPMQNKNFLLLNLSLSSDRSLDEQILQGINEATDKVWSSLKEFNAFLKGGKRMRLVISIDDLHKWLSSGECLKDLIDVISAHTDLNAIYWLITLEYTSYDKVADDEVADESESHPWKVYSYRPKKEEHHHLNAKDQERLISIGGWLDLDELNRSRKIGLELLRQQLSSKDEDDLRALQTLDERADALRYLSSPFIAWILRHLREELQLPLSRVVNLNFIEFITYYWRKLRSIIDPHPLSREQVQQCILLIAEFLVQSNDLAPNRTFLLNRIQKAAIDRSDLQDRRLAEAALAVLERGPLLVRKKTNLEANFMERTEIRFEPFWEYQMASQLQHATIERGYTDEAWSKIQTWFRLCHPQGIKQGVFEFLLLLLDRDLNYKSSDIIDNMLNLGINDQESLTAAMWFAGPKLSIEKQSSLVDLAAMPRAYTNTRNLFAFMYFVSECVPEVLDIPSRLALLQPHYKTIHEASLVNYYLYIVERLFMKLKDNNIVLSCMMHFSGCEIMGITQILAELAVKRLAQNMRDEMNVHSEMNGLLDIVLEYLRVDYKKTKRDHQTGSNVTSQVRYFYRQWILCEFCRTLVDSVGLTSYDLLVKHHWYEPRKLQIGYPASLEMRQEANLALGTWYRNKAWGEERKFYIELTKKLANSSDPEDRRRAFFLIRHTELTKGRRGVRVERAFHPLLRTLFMDPELQKITESYYEDFQVNLNDVDSLAD